MQRIPNQTDQPAGAPAARGRAPAGNYRDVGVLSGGVVYGGAEADPDLLEGTEEERGGGGFRILAVDDSASARKLFQAVLLRLGVGLPDLRFAASASEALQTFTQFRPNLVFVDIELRGTPAGNGAEGGGPVDGDELARQMLQRNPQLKLVVVTAFDRDHPRVKALLASGAGDVIVKPLLAARVQEVLTWAAAEAKAPPKRGAPPARRR